MTEFKVYVIKIEEASAVMVLHDWSVMILLKGTVSVKKEGAELKAALYSTWLMEPGKYIFSAEEQAEVYISTEGAIGI